MKELNLHNLKRDKIRLEKDITRVVRQFRRNYSLLNDDVDIRKHTGYSYNDFYITIDISDWTYYEIRNNNI